MEKKKYTLPKEFAEKWIEALRSGEYKQGKNKLIRDGNSYCCLGVACVISGATKRQISGHSYIPKASKVQVPIQIKGMASERDIVNMVSKLNDSGKSFTYISDWIEQNVEFI